MPEKFSEQFKGLKQEIAPSQDWVNSTRDLLLSQINPQNKLSAQSVNFFDYINVSTSIFKRPMFEPAVIMLVVLGTFLGSSLTINAAFYSLPGDKILYPVKITLEKTHVALITDSNKKAELNMEFAQKRLAELDKIMTQTDVESSEKKRNIETVVRELKNNVVAINYQLQNISQEIKTANNTTPEDVATKVKMAISLGVKSEELVKGVNKTTEVLTAEEADVVEIVSAAAVAVQGVTVSAQEVVTSAEIKEGIVEGVSNTDETVVPGTNLDTQQSLSGDALHNATSTEVVE